MTAPTISSKSIIEMILVPDECSVWKSRVLVKMNGMSKSDYVSNDEKKKEIPAKL